MAHSVEVLNTNTAAVWGHSSGSGGLACWDSAQSNVHGGYLSQHGEIAWSDSAAAASLTFPGKTRVPHQGSSKAKEI